VPRSGERAERSDGEVPARIRRAVGETRAARGSRATVRVDERVRGGDGGKDEVCAASATSGGAAGSRSADRLARSSGFAASWRAFQRHATAEPASTLHKQKRCKRGREGVTNRTRVRLFRYDASRNLVRATATKKDEKKRGRQPARSHTTYNV